MEMDTNEQDMEREGLGADTGMIADIGTAQPGSPADQMGMSVPPPSGGVGALDVGAGDGQTGDDQKHDLGIVDETNLSAREALKPRLVEDIDPERSNLSGQNE
jgi:hypothetical protein